MKAANHRAPNHNPAESKADGARAALIALGRQTSLITYLPARAALIALGKQTLLITYLPARAALFSGRAAPPPAAILSPAHLTMNGSPTRMTRHVTKACAGINGHCLTGCRCKLELLGIAGSRPMGPALIP